MSSEQVRQELGHPIIDSDAHVVEYMPAVLDMVREEAGPIVANHFRDGVAWHGGFGRWGQLSPPERRAVGFIRGTWWCFPTVDPVDRMTSMLPRLLWKRLDEFGIDLAVAFPNYGLATFAISDAETRTAAARAFNRYYAEIFAGLGDRLVPAAIIPMNDPQEAVQALDHAVLELGMKAVTLAGFVFRPLAASGDSPAPARWMDTFGLDSAFDYDPVWRRCVDLGVAPTFHTSGQGWGSRASTENYVANHIGNFAAAGEATCRAFLLGGILDRFPELSFGFLEGGVTWAASLFSDLVGHFEKRGPQSIGVYDPKRLDRERAASLLQRYGGPRVRANADRFQEAIDLWSRPDEPEDSIQEFDRSGIQSISDLARLFDQLYFGCEADDPLNAMAFSFSESVLGLRLQAMLSSDIGHWDAPVPARVVEESVAPVHRGRMTPRDYREFSFENPLRFWLSTNPRFFDSTRLEDHARS